MFKSKLSFVHTPEPNTHFLGSSSWTKLLSSLSLHKKMAWECLRKEKWILKTCYKKNVEMSTVAGNKVYRFSNKFNAFIPEAQLEH